MNGIQFDLFREFNPPADEGFLTSRFFSHFMSNILTVGINAAIKTVEYQSRMYELEKEQAYLLKKYSHAQENWKEIERRLEKMIDEVIALSSENEDDKEINELQQQIDQLLIDKEELDQEIVELKEESSFISLIRKVIGILNVLTQFSSEFASLGFNGCYQNYLMKKRIKILVAQNHYLENKINHLQVEHQKKIEKNIELLKQDIGLKNDLMNISQTDSAKAYFEVSDLNQQLQSVKKSEEDLEKQVSTLQAQCKVAKDGEEKFSTLLKLNSSEHDKAVRDLKNQIIQLEVDQKELKALRQQIQTVDQSAIAIGETAFDNLQKRAGPLPPKYQPTKKEIESVDTIEDKKFTAAFTKRYTGLEMASDVFKSGFAYALKEIFQMADEGKIKLNRSLGTPTSKGGQIAYRFLALDFIKGGKIVATCHGYELNLNEKDVRLVPSSPENVLKYQIIEGKRQPSITIHFNGRCDLIPGEEILKYTSSACGIDPIAAKCLWAKLSQVDFKHFVNLLLESAVEDDCAELLAANKYLSSLPTPKQKQIRILCDLISDIAVALEAKFKADIAMKEWQKYLDVLDFELQPFVKKGKEDFIVIKHPIIDEKDEPLIPWLIDFDTLSGDTKSAETQADFYSVILEAQETHQVYFNNLKSSLLQYPMSKGKIIHNITWEQLKHQFHITHQMIGQHGCLLSNFLATLMVDRHELVAENIASLKIAMANYLDSSHHAKEFEGALKNEFKCTVNKFKDWLREKNSFLNGVELTPTVLSIAAYTLGIHVVLFTPPSDSQDRAYTKGKVDEYGRLMPIEDIEGHHFGPPTKEVLFMAVENDYSYYGLFPKMKKTTASKQSIDTQDWEIIENLNKYWQSIETSI